MRAHPSSGGVYTTLLTLSQINGRVLGLERCPLATSLNRRGKFSWANIRGALRHVLLPSWLPAPKCDAENGLHPPNAAASGRLQAVGRSQWPCSAGSAGSKGR